MTAEGAAPEPGPPEDEPTVTGIQALAARQRERIATGQARANELLERYHDRPLVDVGLRIFQRDRESAGSVVGSAIAFRLFLFFVPVLLFVVGLAGFLTTVIDEDDLKPTSVTGSLAVQIDTALSQTNATRWIAVAAGLVGMALAGRVLSRVLVAASCLAWRLPITMKARPRLIGAIIGLLVGMALITTVINEVRSRLGLAVAGLSFIAAFGIYVVAWLLLSMLLPKPTSDPGSLLPGAAIVGLTLAGLQAFSQLFLPDQFSRASQLYGAIGITVVTLGWFFILGRTIVLSMSVNAAVYERFGSISQLVFSLPLLRALPRRWPYLRRFFGLDEQADGEG